MKASSRRVREGVFCRYWFHTWKATSCGEDLFDNDELGFMGAVVGVGEERALECEGTGFVGGGVAPDEDFLGAITENLDCLKSERVIDENLGQRGVVVRLTNGSLVSKISENQATCFCQDFIPLKPT